VIRRLKPARSTPSADFGRGDDWMRNGAIVVHRAFGTGRVVRVGRYKGVLAAWIDFDRGDRKALDPQYASPHLRLRLDSEPLTPPDPGIKCDVCGDRPVLVTVAGAGGTQQFCEAHRTSYRR
jgi:hypothetical protein